MTDDGDAFEEELLRALTAPLPERLHVDGCRCYSGWLVCGFANGKPIGALDCAEYARVVNALEGARRER